MSNQEQLSDAQLYTKYPNIFNGLGFLAELSQKKEEKQQNQPDQGKNDQNDQNEESQGKNQGKNQELSPTSDDSNSNPTTLSVEEQRVYDRQIRTWGLEAQTMMRTAKILFIGRVSCLGSEICKNLTLAGIGQLTICDNTPLSTSSFESNFLLSETHQQGTILEGITEGQASIGGLKALNPNVKIEHLMKPQGKIENLTKIINIPSFTIIIACGIDMLDAVYLNHLCRCNTNDKNSPIFVYTDINANYGLSFFDLNSNYDYFLPTVLATQSRKEAAKNSASSTKKNKLGTHYRALAVSLGTSLARMGIDIDGVMMKRDEFNQCKEKNDLNIQNDQNDQNDPNNSIQLLSSYTLPVPLIDQATFSTTIKQQSALNHDAVYLDGSYVAKKEGEVVKETGDNIKNDETKKDEKMGTNIHTNNKSHPQYHTLPNPTSRDITRALAQAYISNYFVCGFKSPSIEMDKIGKYPIGLLQNVKKVEKNNENDKNDENSSKISFYEKIIENNGITNGLEIVAYSAILGGVVSQEILRTFERLDQTILKNNWIHLDMSKKSGECVEACIM